MFFARDFLLYVSATARLIQSGCCFRLFRQVQEAAGEGGGEGEVFPTVRKLYIIRNGLQRNREITITRLTANKPGADIAEKII